MLQCDIKGCTDLVSEKLSSLEELKRWVILRACRCGAFDHRTPKVCVCNEKEGPLDQMPVPITYWPMLDWWRFGGVEQLILCPEHKAEVMALIVHQQSLDPTMDAAGQGRTQDWGNRH
jgi:hypothetical protein